MTQTISKIIFATIALLVAGCNSKQAPAPQETKAPAPTTLNEAAQPPVPAIPTPAAPAQGAALAGSWSGHSGEDTPLTFTVKDNQVSSVYAGFHLNKGGCTAFASFSSDAVATLNGKTFTLQGSKDQMNDRFQFTIAGTFSSDKDASGTIHWTGKSGLCGDIDTQANWSAKKETESETFE